MTSLQRMTTQYVEKEDRLCLAGEWEPGQTVVLWLTQRLLWRLLPHLWQWLEQQTPGLGHSLASTVQADVLQSFAQQAAVAQLEPQAPVATDAAESGWLITSVDVGVGEQGVTLSFKQAPGEGAEASAEVASVTFEAQPLRQWLSIVLEQWRRAGWPVSRWPDWMLNRAPVADADGRSTALLH
ncbi:MAG: hypothetical protein PHI55_12230 [Burkholderiaceae bacterium]|nr:hypothetical protein [Burkholderiaceae bacterium]